MPCPDKCHPLLLVTAAWPSSAALEKQLGWPGVAHYWALQHSEGQYNCDAAVLLLHCQWSYLAYMPGILAAVDNQPGSGCPATCSLVLTSIRQCGTTCDATCICK
jgi:hypothetical protein